MSESRDDSDRDKEEEEESDVSICIGDRAFCSPLVPGIGGLGMMAVKLAKAMECDDVIAFTSSPSKVEGALALGASKVCVTGDEEKAKVREKKGKGDRQELSGGLVDRSSAIQPKMDLELRDGCRVQVRLQLDCIRRSLTPRLPLDLKK